MMNKELIIILIFATVYSSGTADQGIQYAKEKVCEELRLIGSNNFKTVVTAVYSQKFPNGTFEEVNCVADEMGKLAERCCQDDASLDCYDKGATEISDKSCRKDSPFPKHPGIEQCCTIHGEERKLCLAMLRYSADELPSLLENTPEEICTQYTKDPSSYALRYVYEYSRRHRTIPAGFVLNVTQRHMRMAENCCKPTVSKPCFFRERYQENSLAIFLKFLSNMCNNEVNLRSHKTGLTAYFGSFLSVPFEEALAISKQFQSALAKCCLQPQPQCVIEEFISFQKVLCKDGGNKSKELQRCCSKAPLDAITCMDTVKRYPVTSSDVPQVHSSQLCEETHPDRTDRYLFQIGVKHVSVSLPVLTTIQDHMRSTVSACCSGTNDTTACLKESKLEKDAALVSLIDDFCLQYFKLELPAFKTKIQHEFQGDELKSQAWIDLTTSCCFQHSPAQLCQKLTEAIIKYEDVTAA
ncbi:vitamin D-binding protein [Tachysurus vachellii]|nr:vitamin D-binding protein [Tachysurus vachellii]